MQLAGRDHVVQHVRIDACGVDDIARFKLAVVGVDRPIAIVPCKAGDFGIELELHAVVKGILCQRNGIDGKTLAITQLSQKYTEMEPKQLREYLKSIRTAANQISADMFRFLDAKSHGSRQRDDAR